MKDALNRYVRSLTERERANEGPETTQDLGTFVDWLLERRGYEVLLRAYKHTGTKRRKSAGRIQFGVDTIAIKPNGDGTSHLYYLVLKTGPVGTLEWGQSGVRGALVHDLRLAAARNLQRDLEDHGVPADAISGVTVVAVHNGDFDVEVLGGARVHLENELRAQHSVCLEWWDAAALVTLAVEDVPGVDGPDAGLLPPTTRPFARLALDSLRIEPEGHRFDLEVVNRFVEAALPLGRTLTETDGMFVLGEGQTIPPPSLRRTMAEFEIVAEMLIVESQARHGGNSFPALDSIERMLVRVMEQLRRCTETELHGHKKALRASIESIVERYVGVVQAFCQRLDPLLVGENSLAMPSGSEPVTYPLRLLRMAGCIAVGGLAVAHRSATAHRAASIASTLEKLWMTNRAACEGPVTDDQVIEHGLVWEFLLLMGRKSIVQAMATGVIQRSLHRRALGQPLPALYHHARTEMRSGELRDLIEAFIGRQLDLIDDEGSTLLPLALYVAARLGEVPDEVLTTLQQHEGSGKQCVLQAWRCRDDAPGEWYAHEIHHTGTTCVLGYVPQELRGAGYPGVGSIDELVLAIDRFATPPVRSAAERWMVPVVDRMAFKVFRTRPPLSIFVNLLGRS